MVGKLSRRTFVKGTAAALAAPLIIPAHVLGRNGAVPPSEQIPMASIGLGFAWETGLYNPHTRMLAVCDVQRDRRDNGKRLIDEKYGNHDCQTYNDYRELLARRDIDAVYIAAPDHWHALITIAAAEQGKDIYCQKAAHAHGRRGTSGRPSCAAQWGHPAARNAASIGMGLQCGSRTDPWRLPRDNFKRFG